MSRSSEPPEWLWRLFQQLRQRGFVLGIPDYDALRHALAAGFGWSSAELRNVCVTLWAKSRRDADIVEALMARLNLGEWILPATSEVKGVPRPPSTRSRRPKPTAVEPHSSVETNLTPVGNLPTPTLAATPAADRRFVFAPQYPIGYREVAQAWRRLRRPVRTGPPIDLDVDATVGRRSRSGIVSPPVLLPRRRNMARLLVLVDRFGSMTPFHGFVEEVCEAIAFGGSLEWVRVCYFHDLPSETVDVNLLREVSGELFVRLDPILTRIAPATAGFVADDAELTNVRRLSDVLAATLGGTALLVISDAGAARGNYDARRLIGTIAMIKGIRATLARYVWLNPVPLDRWTGTTAAQIARHVPMFPLDRSGMHRAVDVLRGHPMRLERAA